MITDRRALAVVITVNAQCWAESEDYRGKGVGYVGAGGRWPAPCILSLRTLAERVKQ